MRGDAASTLRCQRHTDAVGLLLRYAAACDAASTPTSLCRAYLGAVVVHLFSNNAAEAWQVYQVSWPHRLDALQLNMQLWQAWPTAVYELGSSAGHCSPWAAVEPAVLWGGPAVNGCSNAAAMLVLDWRVRHQRGLKP